MVARVSDAGDERQRVDRFLETGSERDFRDLYRAHTPALYGFALRLARGNGAEAEDVVQETWLRAVAKLGEFRWQSSLRTWLHGVAINVHREALRRAACRQARIAEARSRLSLVAEAPPAVDLERAIAELPAGCREVLILHDIEGYTHREIGELLGIDEGTSKSQLSRARKKLRTSLEAGESRAKG